MTNLLEQKVAVVTGGTTGIGLAIAQQFASAGARVIITGIDRKGLDQVAAAVRRAGRGRTSSGTPTRLKRIR